MLNSSKTNQTKGTLYVVATPIGNYKDISQRAIDTLKSVDIVLAEDTRRTKPLLQHYGISSASVISFHEHNEEKMLNKVLENLNAGLDVALVSDAGTPLISDPGFGLVAAAHENDIKVVPLPGVCAAVAALSASGLATDQFFFVGFLPAKVTQRKKALLELREQVGTLIIYESSHRILASLQDCLDVLGDREAVLARELTKMFETVKKSSIKGLLSFVEQDSNQQKGEFVVLIEGVGRNSNQPEVYDLDELLQIMMSELPLKQAASLAARISGKKKNFVYQRALELKDALK